jgi:hypothetical protein
MKIRETTMTGGLADSRNQKPVVSYRMSVEQAAAILIAAHSDVQAQRHAWLEQQNARRTRSRKRFSFWLGVESEIKKLVYPPVRVSEATQRPQAPVN